MGRCNWSEKFPSEMYDQLFRFEKQHMELLIRALDVPPFLQFSSRHSTNWWAVIINLVAIFVFWIFYMLNKLLHQLRGHSHSFKTPCISMSVDWSEHGIWSKVMFGLISQFKIISIQLPFSCRPDYLSKIFNNTVMLLFGKWGSFIR